VSGLPPAEYLVATLPDNDSAVELNNWQNPAVLNALAGTAQRVRLGSGQSATTELRVVRAR
jgi:hypothetical protein